MSRYACLLSWALSNKIGGFCGFAGVQVLVTACAVMQCSAVLSFDVDELQQGMGGFGCRSRLWRNEIQTIIISR